MIDLHKQYPDDWKRAWFEIQKKWAEDVGCADGVFAAFDIDARLNAAYVVLGLLYGQGDMTRTISIATRAGQDSDCNPSSAAGILGAIIGYSKIPAFWKQGLADVEPVAFEYAGAVAERCLRTVFQACARSDPAQRRRSGRRSRHPRAAAGAKRCGSSRISTGISRSPRSRCIDG